VSGVGGYGLVIQSERARILDRVEYDINDSAGFLICRLLNDGTLFYVAIGMSSNEA
jgi:hypothetical protein